MKTKILLLSIILLNFLTLRANVIPQKINIQNQLKNNIRNLPHVKTKITGRETIGYYYILHMDGCYHLGRVVLYENGDIWWEPVTGFENGGSYCCTTVICMNEEEFNTLC